MVRPVRPLGPAVPHVPRTLHGRDPAGGPACRSRLCTEERRRLDRLSRRSHNVSGASLLGTPVVNTGFNGHVAWSHTVAGPGCGSAGAERAERGAGGALFTRPAPAPPSTAPAAAACTACRWGRAASTR
ncbi:hypothetical protein GPA10_25930 [Streptomyces sp. p1417]|uniref:Uncharacterized protein n=1 Tax=Streptomyces typhae TaxID=2681492 RepID=A0A6L6X2Q9_9ACTN|nr:hypothetical protein [Streptomyces typhae]